MTTLTVALALAWLQGASPVPEFSPFWEMAKGVMLTFSTAGIGWLISTVRRVEKRQVTLEHLVIGVDGKNGMRSKVTTLGEDVAAIKLRNERIDTITEYEKKQYPGEDRRQGPRRIRDVVREVEEEERDR
jgi:hypothetical protein